MNPELHQVLAVLLVAGKKNTGLVDGRRNRNGLSRLAGRSGVGDVSWK
jgi:hypothetical protein